MLKVLWLFHSCRERELRVYSGGHEKRTRQCGPTKREMRWNPSKTGIETKNAQRSSYRRWALASASVLSRLDSAPKDVIPFDHALVCVPFSNNFNQIFDELFRMSTGMPGRRGE